MPETSTMKKQLKLDLQREQQKVRRYVERRIRDYPHYLNIGPGEDEDPISLITIGFYASQGGYVSLVFDTRPNAGPDSGFDGEWTQYLDDDSNLLLLPSWCDLFDALSDGKKTLIVRHDFIEHTIEAECSPEIINALFGDMLVDLAMKMRNQGRFAKLPLAPNARIAVEEFDGLYFWPNPGERRWPDGKTQALVCDMGRLH
jgi:hypothetical protein